MEDFKSNRELLEEILGGIKAVDERLARVEMSISTMETEIRDRILGLKNAHDALEELQDHRYRVSHHAND